MERQLLEAKEGEKYGEENKIKVHTLADCQTPREDDPLISQCGDTAKEGFREIDGLIGEIHEKCEKCFSENYRRE